LSQFKPELEQFAVDARRTPKQILPASSAGSAAQFRLDRQSALPVRATSNANSGESRPDANVPAFRVE
jgi:hypothetical protein